MMDQSQQKIKPVTIIMAVSAILGLVVLVYGFDTYLDSKINGQLKNPVVIKQIAEQVRPFLIFSGTGVVLVDNGAMQYLDNLDVVREGTARIPKSVILTPKNYMTHAPLITGIDQMGIVARGQRGYGISWIYNFKYSVVFEPGMAPEDITSAEQDRYRLEIIK